MPLSACIDGELVCAPLVPADRWGLLRSRPIELQPCGHRGFPRVSPRGTQHFVHERDSDCHHAESAEHLHLKAVVARAVAAAGWHAATEVPGQGFVADVLATRDDALVAVEVQRSRQVLREYERRQSTYAGAGIRCVWLVNAVPAGHQAGPQLPLFLVQDWLGDPSSVVVGRAMDVPSLVGALLSGQCHWVEAVPAATAVVEKARLICPMCGTAREVEVGRWLQGRCACGLPVHGAASGSRWPEPPKCCGYWGPAVVVSRRTCRVPVQRDMPVGHWCLSDAGCHR